MLSAELKRTKEIERHNFSLAINNKSEKQKEKQKLLQHVMRIRYLLLHHHRYHDHDTPLEKCIKCKQLRLIPVKCTRSIWIKNIAIYRTTSNTEIIRLNENDNQMK